MNRGPRLHIVLVGLPGAGKSTIGRLVAEELSAGFTDLDVVIERRQGMTLAALFAERGEATFRELEREEMERALDGPAGVVASGGGWAAQPGNLERAAGRALTVYLRLAPELAAQRASDTPGRRPLLAGDRLGRMRALFAARQSFYERCDAAVDVAPEDPKNVAREVANLARSQAGWY